MTCPPCTHDCSQGETCPARNKPKREWVGLTEKDIDEIFDIVERDDQFDVIQLVEDKLKELNT